MYILTLEYDGSAFHGSQAQSADKGRTVQGTLEEALAGLTGAAVRVALAGRTDSGVHARGQVAAFLLPRPWEPERLLRALNGVLPPDLAVRGVREHPGPFDPRRDALARSYRYLVWNAPTPAPLLRPTCWWVRAPLDLAAMNAAAARLLGTHDFATFAGAGHGVPHAPAGLSTVRHLDRIAWRALLPAADLWADVDEETESVNPQSAILTPQSDRLLAFDVRGNAFLPHMVRNLVGLLVVVGQGRLDPAAVSTLLAGRDRRLAPGRAPAHGLCLVRVWYET